MPKNKEAFIRYRIIDACLRNKFLPYPSMDELVDACERKLGKFFSPSTLQKDIKAMREDDALGFHAPIKYCRTHDGYYYTDPNYSLAKIPLTSEELNALEFALGIIEPFKDSEIFEHYEGAIDKIMNAVSVRRILDEKDTSRIVQIEKAPAQKGNEYIQPILQAITERLVINIDYKSFQSDSIKKHIIHPYLLKEYRNRWYVIGLHTEFDEIRTFALDRIVDVSCNEEFDYVQNNFIPEKFYKDVVGITHPDGEPPLIKLRFTREQAQYVLTQPLHESQKIIDENEDFVAFSVKVHPTYEFISIVLGYGADVAVEEPEDLRKKIAHVLKLTMMHYMY